MVAIRVRQGQGQDRGRSFTGACLGKICATASVSVLKITQRIAGRATMLARWVLTVLDYARVGNVYIRATVRWLRILRGAKTFLERTNRIRLSVRGAARRMY
jgi:hypothetical protein